MKHRNTVLDLWRFIFALLIMTHHLYHIGWSYEDPYHWFLAWIFVEFFFILTGYLTCKHFLTNDYSNKPQIAFEYTIKKFKTYIPYASIAIITQYLLDGIFYYNNDGKAFISSFFDMPFELALIGETFASHQRLVPIWYLSALFLVFPLFSLLVQIKNKYFLLLISLPSSLIYYGYVGINGNRDWPNDIFRAIAGLLLGVSICIISDIITSQIKKLPSFSVKLLLTLTEFVSLLSVVLMTYYNFVGVNRLIVLLFCIGIVILQSGYSYSSTLNVKLFTFLGKLSMPLFIWHWVIGSAINYIAPYIESAFNISLSMTNKTFLYYGLSIIISLLSLLTLGKPKKDKC